MFHEISASILLAIEAAALAIEVLAVAIIVVAIFFGMLQYLQRAFSEHSMLEERFAEYKVILARALLLGLEILVAADIIKTVALETTLESVAVLGLLVLIRIFLGWSLIVEIEGRWPWQAKPTPEHETAAE